MKNSSFLSPFFCFGINTAFAQLVEDQSDYEPFADSTGFGGTGYSVGQPLFGNSPTLPAGFDSTATAGVGIPSWWEYTNATTTRSTPSVTLSPATCRTPAWLLPSAAKARNSWDWHQCALQSDNRYQWDRIYFRARLHRHLLFLYAEGWRTSVRCPKTAVAPI
jgi:hypothetical protein